jgi:osmoprotectant transport system ATP-binding protein
VTHDIDEAFLLGDQVVILEKGAHIAQVGTPTRSSPRPPATSSPSSSASSGLARPHREEDRARHRARGCRGPRTGRAGRRAP